MSEGSTDFRPDSIGWNDGGAEGTRTLYLLVANEALYQMSYRPGWKKASRRIAARPAMSTRLLPRCDFADRRQTNFSRVVI